MNKVLLYVYEEATEKTTGPVYRCINGLVALKQVIELLDDDEGHGTS